MNAALREILSPYRHPCGGLKLTVNGEACVLRCSGALWLPGRQALIASDLHLEKGSAFAARGQMLPPYDSPATLARLEAEIDALDPRAVVLLGDSFHDSKAVSRMDGAQLARLERLAAGRDWIWLEGNHDLDALAGLISRISRFIADHQADLSELDINPVICGAGRVVAVDALIIKKQDAGATRDTPKETSA